ncbi:MAG: monovalent cation/H(+) antiporter subunit G [Desulfobacteraceae bacterium]|nr:MAG: monovalent cation/H(+) antiporter subunit G [Desulfobacteraceae bacterium]
MSEIVTAFFMLAGGFFCFIASVGILRLPDTIIRMHAATKAGAFGTGLMFLALAVFYMDLSTTLRAFAAIFFILLTAPVAAHLIGRAAYCTQVKLSKRTHIDELATTCRWCRLPQQETCEEDRK